MSKTDIPVEEIEDVNWQQYFHEPKRCAHEIANLEPIPLELSSNTKATVQEDRLENQRVLRMRCIASLMREIQTIDELIER